MELTAKHLGDSRFEIVARGHRVISDQPYENGGADSGMSPPEFLLASLAACAGHYCAQYLKARGLNAEDLQVKVSAEKGERPARLASFRIEVTAPALDDHHRAALLRAARSCLIHNTLLTQPGVEIIVTSATPLAA